MTIIKSFNNSCMKILTQDEFKSASDIEQFINALNENKDLCCELSFVDIKSLPLEVIDAISALSNRCSIIYTNERTLWLYLNGIGLKTRLDSPYKDVNKKDYIISAIAIGGSAGSIEKTIEIIKNIQKANIAIFITIHLKDDRPSLLSQILQKHTKNYIIKDARDNQLVENGTIYIAVPDKHMVVSGGRIFLTSSSKVSYSRPSINVTFNSLALEYQDGLVAVLLCGYGDDGSASLHHVIEDGGSVLIEEPVECMAKDMLTNAIKKENHACVLSLENIILKLNKMISTEDGTEVSDDFLYELFLKYGYDFRNYDKKMVQRRVEVTKKRVAISDDILFQKTVLEQKHIFLELFLDLSINVTTFFRNPVTFTNIRDRLIPYLSSYPEIKIWCAGCSSGEEPYSLAIILKELGLLDKSLIYATDFNTTKLKEAKNGAYSKEKFELFKENYLKSGGEQELENYFNTNNSYVTISDEIKSKVLFFQHNLVADGVLNEFQLIFCRNVMIYFNSDLRSKVFNLLDSSLVRNGFLVYGESEMLNVQDTKYKVAYAKEDRIYQKKR